MSSKASTRLGRAKAPSLMIQTDAVPRRQHMDSTASAPTELTPSSGTHKKEQQQQQQGHDKVGKHSEALASSNWRATAQPVHQSDAPRSALLPGSRVASLASIHSGDSGKVSYRHPVAGAGKWEDTASAPPWKLRHSFGRRGESVAGDDAGDDYDDDEATPMPSAATDATFEEMLGRGFASGGVCAVVRRAVLSDGDCYRPLQSAPATKMSFDLSIIDVIPTKNCAADGHDDHRNCACPRFGFAELSIVTQQPGRSATTVPVHPNRHAYSSKDLRGGAESQYAAVAAHILADPAVAMVLPRGAGAAVRRIQAAPPPSRYDDVIVSKLRASAVKQFYEGLGQYRDPHTGRKLLQEGGWRDEAECRRWISAITAEYSKWFPHQEQQSHHDPADSPSKNSSLNPKAREFLSIGEDPRPSKPPRHPSLADLLADPALLLGAALAGHPTLQHVDALSEPAPSATAHCGPDPTVGWDSAAPHPPPYGFAPWLGAAHHSHAHNPGHDHGAVPADAPPMLMAGPGAGWFLAPPGGLALPRLAQDPSALAAFPPPPYTQHPPPARAATPPPPPPHHYHNHYAAPPGPVLAGPARPPVWLAHAHAQPPMPARALDRLAPPKPRHANAAAQQQYEAWIEQRKAMDPTYAVQCKVRQARRHMRAGAV